MKKLFAACVVLLLLAGCALGGDASSASPPGPTPTLARQTLKVCIESADGVNYKGLFTRFESLFPEVELIVEEIPASSPNSTSTEREAYLLELRTEVMAGRGPDVFFLHGTPWNAEVFSDLPKAMRQGAFLDVAPLLHQKGYNAEDYLTTVVQAGQIDGKQYLFPLGYIPNAVGVTPESAAQVKGSSTPLELMQRLMALDSTCNGATVQPFLYGLHLPILDYTEETARFSSDATRELCELYLEWDQRPWGVDDPMNPGLTEYLEGRWHVLGDTNNSFYNAIQLAKQEMDTAFIGVPGADGGYSATVSLAFGVRANSKAAAAAVNLLLLALEEEFQTGPWCEFAPKNFGEAYLPGDISALPVRKGCLTAALARPYFNSFYDSSRPVGEKNFAAPLLSGAVASLQELEDGLTQVSWGWPVDCLIEWNNALAACWRGEAELDATLSDFQIRWQRYLSE